ncbi:hypothetical protein M9H77_21858 [Catharanthus roseus]|uniref:Uncharacterized protein n=1 Tax=Catharanthus roseus TaxID=4058 RepID=A0ACC0AQ96_CATRO|nr:hypothetical protein M9H77_21858 [Catharanthus roseus]
MRFRVQLGSLSESRHIPQLLQPKFKTYNATVGLYGQSPDPQHEVIGTKFRHLVVNTSQTSYERSITNNRILISLIKTGYRLLGHLPGWATPSRYYAPLQVDPPSESKTHPCHRKRP